MSDAVANVVDRIVDPGSLPMFMTIRQAARLILPERTLRDMLKSGNLPGFYQGSRFYVNTLLLTEQLNGLSRTGHDAAAPDTANSGCRIVNLRDLQEGGFRK